ncbi:hypothetical protein [Neobacillus sp. CF12]|uniref:hypothetical protein n=1 Tax=Neobacillus sp. CF12 TaxID=3055864 RepID=UPI0025A218D6|nr:hypothetical protein [Neobacillus sp. CF12]MDM5328570.1 hypothetical protein [Neobacillus sp. CF12]
MRPGSLTKLTISNPIVDRVKETISSTHLNGGMIIECFQINNPELLNYPTMNETFERYFTRILTSDDIRISIPELKIGKQLDCETDFKFISSFTLDGAIASVIYNGGAYKGFYGTPREAKNLAQEFCDFIFEDRVLDVQVYQTNTPWCSWFFDVAWDDTWLILDTNLKKIWLICITDTD